MVILESGNAEPLKAVLHGTVEAFAAVFCLYNAAAFLTRDQREWHLALNAALYGGLTIFEHRKVRHHRERICASSPPSSLPR